MLMRVLARMQRAGMASTSLRQAARGLSCSYQLSTRSIQTTRMAQPEPRPRHLFGASRQLHLTAAAASSEGPITSELIANMRTKIAAALETELVEVQDMQGDGRHVEITVISSLFDGKSAVNRQRMVYKAIWEELQATVHAVDAMVTKTPEEAGIKL